MMNIKLNISNLVLAFQKRGFSAMLTLLSYNNLYGTKICAGLQIPNFLMKYCCSAA